MDKKLRNIIVIVVRLNPAYPLHAVTPSEEFGAERLIASR